MEPLFPICRCPEVEYEGLVSNVLADWFEIFEEPSRIDRHGQAFCLLILYRPATGRRAARLATHSPAPCPRRQLAMPEGVEACAVTKTLAHFGRFCPG